MPPLNNIDTPAPSVIFSTLASARRRIVLRELIDYGPSLTVTTLANRISDEESSVDSKRVCAQLHHGHLPKLEDSGIVTVDGEVVTVTDSVEALRPHLLLAERYESRHKK